MINQKYLPRGVVILFLLASLPVACSKKDKSGDDDDDSTTTSATGGGATPGTSINGLSAAYPQTLALSVFPQTTTGASLDDTVADPNADKSVKEKTDDNKKKISGEGDCIDPHQFQQLKSHTPVTCYDFDADMNPTVISGQSRTSGTVDGTNGSGEACMVSFTRAEVDDAVQTVDRALALVSGMLCQAKKDGVATAMPDVGATLDLKTSFAKAGPGLLDVTTAKIARLDDVAGNPVYRSDVEVKGPDGRTMQVHLLHSPAADGTSSGSLWFQRQAQEHQVPGAAVDPNNTSNKNDLMSINYNNSVDADGAPRVQMEVRRAQMINTVDGFTSNGLLDYEAVSQSASNSDIHAIKYVAFDMNPNTNAGNLSYWMNPGGNYNESARGFLFNITADDAGVLKGCGTSGATAGVSVRKSLADSASVLAPVRYWHPRESQNISADKDTRYTGNEGNLITEQCFKQGAEGVYAIDTDVTTDSHGYTLVTTAASNVKPPEKPEQHLDGDFKPKD